MQFLRQAHLNAIAPIRTFREEPRRAPPVGLQVQPGRLQGQVGNELPEDDRHLSFCFQGVAERLACLIQQA